MCFVDVEKSCSWVPGGEVGAGFLQVLYQYWTVMVKKDLCLKAKLSIYHSVSVPTLEYGQELWVATERTWRQVRASEMRFLSREAGFGAQTSAGRPE